MLNRSYGRTTVKQTSSLDLGNAGTYLFYEFRFFQHHPPVPSAARFVQRRRVKHLLEPVHERPAWHARGSSFEDLDAGFRGSRGDAFFLPSRNRHSVVYFVRVFVVVGSDT